MFFCHSFSSECTKDATLFLNNCFSTDTLCAFDKLFIGQERYPMLVGDAGAVTRVENVLLPCPMNQWEYGTNTHHSLSSECTKDATFFLNNCFSTDTLCAFDKGSSGRGSRESREMWKCVSNTDYNIRFESSSKN